MSVIDLTMPNITGSTPEQAISQIKSYLWKMSEELKYALNSINNDVSNAAGALTSSSSANQIASAKEQAKSNFVNIKDLIIKSSDIVDAYTEVITKSLEGKYVASSEFGIYKNETASQISANSEQINQAYSRIEQLSTDIGSTNSSLIIKGTIKSGLLETNEEGIAVYGVEVGQIVNVDGTETFNKYARFTADRLSFYDRNGNDVAYISDYKLYITTAQITNQLYLGQGDSGRYAVKLDNGIVFKWM